MEYTLEYLGTEADRYLAELSYPTTAPGLFEPVKYTFETGGKRVRPAVCMATYAALSGRDPHEIINQACAIEMFHNFTLLHDDVMDRAEVRRGRPPVHVKWDTASAILSGDAMLTLAYDMIADGSGEHFAKIFRLFSKTAMEIYEGQQLDMEFESRSDVSVEEYMEMITLKTSVLIGCACRMGAELAGADADTCHSDSKAYMTATSNVIDQEKMAVILQEVVGKDLEGYYFPSFSGVGRSLNYYPLNDEKPEDGVAEIAVGLGKYIVDGGLALRFSPRHPENVLQTSELSLALRDTQTRMYALDMKGDERETSLSGQPIKKPESMSNLKVDDGYNVAKLRVQDVAERGALKYMVSTFDFRDNVIRDSDFGEGRRVVTFNNILKHKAYPLAEAVDFMLTTGQEAMQRPVEIEFAGMVEPNSSNKGRLYWLQIRPIVDRKETVDEALMSTPDEKLLLKSGTALGHGSIEGVNTVVYVRPEKFSSSNNSLIAREIEKINRGFLDREERYVLIGPGRWGSSDTSLGIPVKWPAISAAKLIVESSLPNYRIEPSQGTHFFQNLTSFGVAYFTIDTNAKRKPGDPVTDLYDVDFLNAQPAVYESDFVRIVTFSSPLAIGVNGLKGTGVVVKP